MIGVKCADIYLRFPEIMEEEFDDLVEFLEDEHIRYEGATDIFINLQNQVEKLTQENNDLEERVIHQDNLIKQLRGNCKDLGKKNENQREELNRLLKQREKFKTKHYYLKAEKKHLQSVIDELEKWIKCMQEVSNLDLNCLNATLDKLNELRSKE